MMTLNRTHFLLAFTVSVVVGLAGFGLSKKPAFELVSFNQGKAIGLFASELNERGVSAKKQKILVNHFARALPVALTAFAKSHRVVILSPKEILAGAPDVTEDVLAEIAEVMANQARSGSQHG